MAPRKRTIGVIENLCEPELNAAQRRHLREGVELFNAGRYWHAHEAWEQVWLEMPEGRRGDAEIILRALIQLAAALHLQAAGRKEGATSNLRKAREKLAPAPDVLMGIDLAAVRAFADRWHPGRPPEPPPTIVMAAGAGQ